MTARDFFNTLGTNMKLEITNNIKSEISDLKKNWRKRLVWELKTGILIILLTSIAIGITFMSSPTWGTIFLAIALAYLYFFEIRHDRKTK